MQTIIRKTLTILLIFSVLCTAFTVNAAASDSFIFGDVDDSGEITVRDALSVLKYAVNDLDLNEGELLRADVDDDLDADAEDARLILLCLNDLGSGFRPEDINTNGTIWIAADSIAEGGASYVGWGQVIGNYLVEGTVVNNTAISGQTARYFTRTANYDKIMNNMKAGDVLFIAFGHNDSKGGSGPYESSDTEGSYKYYLKHFYIEPALRKGVVPILMTSVARCHRIDEGEYMQYHYLYIQAAKELAEEYHEKGIELPFIDMFRLTFSEYQYLGKAASRTIYHARDDVHYNEYGANWAAQLILHNIQKKDWDFAKYISEEIEDPRECVR